MAEIILRIPWNPQHVWRFILRLATVVLIIYGLFMLLFHRVTKYPVDPTTNGWIITLPHGLPFEGYFGLVEYEVCLNTSTQERLYVRTSSGGFSVGRMYYNKDGQFIGDWGAEDYGPVEGNEDSIGGNLDLCKRVPSWFFDLKVTS